jgi:hypothetical protein
VIAVTIKLGTTHQVITKLPEMKQRIKAPASGQRWHLPAPYTLVTDKIAIYAGSEIAVLPLYNRPVASHTVFKQIALCIWDDT